MGIMAGTIPSGEPPNYTQCCGLGGCAGGKEPELAKGMACHVTEEGYETVYTYCASCAGNLTRNGGQGVSHLLTEILDYHEQPDVAKSMINRMKTRFWERSWEREG